MQSEQNQITALILTYNGERLLEDCLRSVLFCDKVLVVDSYSQDSTVQIAEKLGAEVLQNVWHGPGPQFEFAFSKITTPWVFSLDQDEICTETLKESVLNAVRTESSQNMSGYYVRRRSWYFNRFMYHSGWYPDELLRLFRPGNMHVNISGAHYSFRPDGLTGKLKDEILHYPYENFEQHLDKINSYASQGAADLRAKGKRGGLAPALAHGSWRFIKLYLLKAGFLDGKAGFINAAHGAFYAFCKYLRITQSTWGAPYDHQ